MTTAVRSHAKINLGLSIGAPRPDGFHALATVYQTLELFDLVKVTARPAAATALRLTSNDSRVPTDQRNTAWKMVALALKALGLTAEVEIHIEKRLPVQGGLGAGSANAVAALVGLEAELGMRPGGANAAFQAHFSRRQWMVALALKALGLSAEVEIHIEKHLPAQDGLSAGAANAAAELDAEPGMGNDVRGFPPSKQNAIEGRGTQSDLFDTKGDPSFSHFSRRRWEAKRLEIAAEIGSDVPLFLIGGAVLGLDRGQQVYPLPDFEPVWCVVAIPELGVSTPQAFRDWDFLCTAEGLTASASTDKLNELSRAYASAFAGAIPGVESGSIPEGRQGAGSSGVLPMGENLAGPQESALVRTGIIDWIQNDFERVVFPQHPSLGDIKRILWGFGTPEAAIHASLSGSGSALYGLYRTRGDAEAAQVRLKQQLLDVEVRSTLTRTLPRLSYWREMLLPQAG